MDGKQLFMYCLRNNVLEIGFPSVSRKKKKKKKKKNKLLRH